VVAAPHTPATGRRILGDPALTELLAGAVRTVADDANASSIHWLFCTEEEQRTLASLGFMARATYQFHWKNRGYASFDAFLGELKSRKRKQLRKERQKARAAIDRIIWVPGRELDDKMIADFDRFYRSTTDNHGGRDYLRPGFFHACARELPDTMQVVFVERGGKRIAGALFFETSSALYGRYWGADAHVDLLHFETAYYAGIERAIDKQLPLFEAGAQGEHKLVRGFEPCMTYSAHWLRHPGLAAAIEEHLARERIAVAAEIEQLASFGPYREADGPDDE
jgi:predicted N-acyltransferase